MPTRLSLYFAGALWLLAPVALAQAQVQSQPYFPIEPEAYRLRLVNELGMTVRLKFVGARADANFSYELRPNESVTRDFYAGDRMLGAWDERNRLVFQAPVRVDRAGRLRLRNARGPYAAREGGGGAAPADAAKMGTLEIEKE